MSESSGSSTSTGSTGATGGESSSGGAQAQGAAAEAAGTEAKAQDTQGEASAEAEKVTPEGEKAKKKEQPPKKEGEEPGKKEEAKEGKPPHKYHERLTKAFPDRTFEKDEDYDTAMDEYLTSLEDYREKGKKANQKLLALFESEPAVGEMVRDMMSGASFREAAARHFSAEDFTPTEGDPDYEGWTKNKTEREEKMNKRREFEKTFAANLETAGKELEAFAKEHNLDEKATDEFLVSIEKMLEDFNNGKITKDSLRFMRRAMTYEQDIKDAREEGRIAGRNEKIVAQREEEPDQAGDGIPKLGKSPDSPDEGKKGGYFGGLRDRMRDRGFLDTER